MPFVKPILKSALTLLVGGLAVVIAAPDAMAAPLPFEFWNEFDPVPLGFPAPNNFEVVYRGDVTAQIPPQTPGPVGCGSTVSCTDAFLHPNPITVTLIAGNTVVAWSGDPGPVSFNPAGPHFGLDNGIGPSPADILGKFYTIGGFQDGPTLPAPTVASGGPHPPVGNWKFAVVFLKTTDLGGKKTGTWAELPYLTGFSPDLSIGNFNPITAFTISNAEFLLSATQIPLEQLNFDLFPPTDPRFQPLPGFPDGTVLLPGQVIKAPEPASLGILGIGLLALLGLRRRSRLVTA